MAEWLKLRTDPPRIGEHLDPDVVFDLVVSPYAIPEAVRGAKTHHGRFRIEFRYIDGAEPEGERIELDEYVTAIEGRFSKRLLALDVDMKALGAKSIGVAISTLGEQEEFLRAGLRQALDRVVASRHTPDEKRVMATARTAIARREQDLLTQFASS